MELIGRYRVLRPLASGGMGQVFLAEDPALERQVALKLLHRDPDRGLRREAKTLAALSHPNIVTIFEIGEHEGHDFIAMEYLPGKTLRDILTGTPPSREELVAIVQSVAVAVNGAHKAGILHRDIKPENVVTTPNGVKVVDFGIARRLGRRAPTTNPDDMYEMLLTPGPRTLLDGVVETIRNTIQSPTVATAGTQTVFGTPAYMAPEVLGGEASTTASDVYSLGVMLYECLAGKRPYDAGNLIETIAHIVQAPPPTLADPLNPLLVRMLARDPDDRPPLAEVIAALRPVEAAPPPVKRGRWWIGGAITAVAVSGLAVATLAMRDREVSAVAEPAPPTFSLAFAGVAVDVASWGVNRSNSTSVAETMVVALGPVQRAQITAITVDGWTLKAQLANARDKRVDYLVSLKIDEDKDSDSLEIIGKLQIYDPKVYDPNTPFDPEKIKPFYEATLRRPAMQVTALEYAMLDTMLARLAPGSALPRVHDRKKAQEAVNAGRLAVQSGDFDAARPQFELAVMFDPEFADAWYGFALALGWTEAPEDIMLQAAERAYELAPSGRRKELMRGAALFFREHFKESREVLEKIEAHGNADADQLELLYYLGEANWHDGRHDAAYGYFRRAYDIPPRSRVNAIHPAQYLIARRQNDEARYLAGAAGITDTNQIEFSMRAYKQLANGAHPIYRMMAKFVLGQPVDESLYLAHYRDKFPIELEALRAARAVAAGDRAKASAHFATMFEAHLDGKKLNAGDFYQTEYAGEVAIAAGLVDEAKRIVKLLAEHSKARPRRGYHRLAMLTAALARDASMIPPDGPTVSERAHKLQAAAEAEIAGDHAKAARALAEVVNNPSWTWDYPERAALLRNLRAMGDTKAIAALCKDTLEPAVYRQAYIVLRALCIKK